MKPEILVTRRLPARVMERLESLFKVEQNTKDRAMTRKELLKAVSGKHGILPTLADRIDVEVIEAAGHELKIVSNYAVGYNNIDVKACAMRNILVTNTPGVLTDTTADCAFGMILAVARRFVFADDCMRSGRFSGWAPEFFLGTDVHHKVLGIVGFGRIGQAVARRALGFGMKILYHSRRPKDFNGAERADMKRLLKESDFVSLHVPATPETRHMIGKKELGLMKPEAFLINTSRGEVVDEKALVQALGEGLIAGAALDVYENEPEAEPGLSEMENVLMLPHIGSATFETRTEMGLMAAANLEAALLKNMTPPNIVTPRNSEQLL